MVVRLGNLFCNGLLLALGAGTALGNPTITNFTPTFGAWGDNVTIEGTGFSPGTLMVYFNGVQDTSARLTAPNAIQSRVPTNATTGPITVKVGTSSGSSLQDFTVIGPGPYITSFSPYVGSDGDTVMVQGAHFT